jgi:5-methylthioribose kinase
MTAVSTGPLTAPEVAGYLADRPALRELIDPATVTVSEVGDGNLNQVFVCADAAGRRLVLKQSLPYVRLVGPSWPMTEQRADREAAALRVHCALSGVVCRLLGFDAERHVLALEDLSDHEVLRSRLNAGGSHAGVVEVLSDYVADVAFGTSFLALGEQEFRRRAAAAVNPELCAITEDLVLTEPYLGAERNSVRAGVEAAVRRLQDDAAWVDAALALRHRFLTTQEALVHGDLHTGSVFVRGTAGAPDFSVKAFDAEFACYGPVGFDLGLLWANLLFAGVRATVLGEPERARSLVEAVPRSWERFCARLTAHWPRRQSPASYPDSFLGWWLRRIRSDALGFAGCEAARRTIGLAKVSDLESLDDAAYVPAAGTMLQLSRLLLVERDTLGFERLTRAATG